MADFYSYEPHLRAACRAIRPASVLEWDCLKVASRVLSPYGVVLLHDAERARHELEWMSFPFSSGDPAAGNPALAKRRRTLKRYERALSRLVSTS